MLLHHRGHGLDGMGTLIGIRYATGFGSRARSWKYQRELSCVYRCRELEGREATWPVPVYERMVASGAKDVGGYFPLPIWVLGKAIRGYLLEHRHVRLDRGLH